MPGEGSIYQLRMVRHAGEEPRLRWVAQLSIGPRGARRLQRRYVPWADNTRRRATALLREMQAERLPAGAAETLSTYLPRWLARYTRRVGPSQAANARAIVDIHLLPVLGDLTLGELRASDVEAVLARTAAARKPSTVRHVYNLLSVALDDAIRDDLIRDNPVRRLPRPSVPRTDKRPWTLEECGRFLAACEGDEYRALYVLVAATGIRQAEALGLAWDDVDLDRGLASITVQLARRDGRYVRVPLKSDGRPHLIHLPRLATDALRAHRTAQAVVPLSGGLIFHTAAGRPVSGSVVTHRLARIAKAAGLPARDFHGLRRFRASLDASLGTAPGVTQAALGHANVTTTLGIYTYTDDAMGRRAAEAVDEALRRVM
jgi:integrase